MEGLGGGEHGSNFGHQILKTEETRGLMETVNPPTAAVPEPTAPKEQKGQDHRSETRAEPGDGAAADSFKGKLRNKLKFRTLNETFLLSQLVESRCSM